MNTLKERNCPDSCAVCVCSLYLMKRSERYTLQKPAGAEKYLRSKYNDIRKPSRQIQRGIALCFGR